MTILMEYGLDTDKRMRYNVLTANGTNLSEMIGQRLHIKGFAILENTDGNGEVTKRLKMVTDDDEIVGTGSKSFIEGFVQFVECLGAEEATEFEVDQRASKAGRKYLVFKA